MISQVLNRAFVLDQLKAIEKHLMNGSARRRAPAPGIDLPEESDIQRTVAEVRLALTREAARSSAQSNIGLPAASRRSSPQPKIDNSCFISSDPIISLTQSALEVYFSHPDSKDKATPPGWKPIGRRNSPEVPPVTDRTLANLSNGGGSSGRRVFDKFSITDIGWVSSLLAMGISKLKSPHPFKSDPPPAVQMSERCRLIVVGDWGSGLPRAQKVAAAMRSYVDDSLKNGIGCHVIHLGDVYYSGWEYEYRNRFLNYWPVHIEEKDKVGSWSLNGNHDMYSGGHGYFGTLLMDPRFSRQGGTSFFKLFNKHWQILGLDTAWDENGLKDPQASWVKSMVTDNPQRTMIITHHQLFSAYENGDGVGKILKSKLGGLLKAGNIEAAIWGHEHRCILHKQFGDVRFGRLIGHGGVPVYMEHRKDDAYPDPAIYEDRRFIAAGLEKWAYMGFAIFDFDGPHLGVRYVDENGYLDNTEFYV